MTCIRLALYFFDAISARTAVNKSLRSGADFVIFDRYCYDEIANLNLQSALLRRYVKLLLRFVPKLDRSYLLDADPFQARMRKPEYPLDFVYRNWAAYLEMQKLTERMIVILPGSVDDVEREIWRLTLDGLHPPSNAGKGQGSSPRQHDMGQTHWMGLIPAQPRKNNSLLSRCHREIILHIGNTVFRRMQMTLISNAS